jgi:hypothetical protein
MEVILYLGQSQPLAVVAAPLISVMLTILPATAVRVAAEQDAIIPMLVLEQQDKALTEAAEQDAIIRAAAVVPEERAQTLRATEVPVFSTQF